MDKEKQLEDLKSICKKCYACEIATRRDKMVFSADNFNAQVVDIINYTLPLEEVYERNLVIIKFK